MYIPAAFKVEERNALFDFIGRHGFATLVSVIEEVPFATHLPVLLDRGRNMLLGHVARANPHWRSFEGESEAVILFQGPHAYVSPSWYATAPAVPTWNYAAVHVYGVPRAFHDEARLEALLTELVNKYEAARERPWRYDLPEEYRRKMLQGIVGFEMPITRLEGKFKLSQNRSAEDRLGVVEQLGTGDAESRALAALMADHSQE